MDYTKIAEIPFGAGTYTIPEGMKAEIKDGKVIVFKVESDDERIMKNCIHFLEPQKKHHADTSEIDECIAYLEKLKDFQFDYPGLYFYDGEKLHFQGNPAMEEKHKESLHLSEICIENADSFTYEDERIMKDLICGLMWQRDNLESIGPHDNNLILPGFSFTVGEQLAYLEKLKEQPMELLEPDKNVEKIIEDIIRVYGKTQGGWVGGYDIDTLIVNLRRAFELKEQKPTELPKSEDYGIDGLYAAVDILQRTLGKVDGYQTDDGILEHKCAISAVKELYEQPVEKLSKEEYVKRFKVLCDAYEIKLPNREYDIYHLCDDLSKLSVDSGKQKPVEWSEEDSDMICEIIDHCIAIPYIGGTLRLSDERKKELKTFVKSFRPQPQVDLDAIAKREYKRGKQDGYWEGVKAERESCKTFHYESPNWPSKMPDIPTETTTNEGVSSIQLHWKPSEEQMEALDNARFCKFYDRSELDLLYEQLKKL